MKSLLAKSHELGSFTLSCEHLTGLSLAEQTTQIKNNYNLLNKNGLVSKSFAWPFGEDIAELFPVLTTVGFQRGRDAGGLKIPTSCASCPVSVTMPVPTSQKYLLRSFSVKSFTSLGDLMWQVWQAENWAVQNPNIKHMVIFKFETICTGCGYSPKTFELFLRWLYPRTKIGTSNEKINVL